MAKTCEELYIFRIENGIRAIKLKNKTPDQVDVADQFKRLKALNPMMWEDLQEKYNAQVTNYNNSKNKRK
jgi:hypothetical protein